MENELNERLDALESQLVAQNEAILRLRLTNTAFIDLFGKLGVFKFVDAETWAAGVDLRIDAQIAQMRTAQKEAAPKETQEAKEGGE